MHQLTNHGPHLVSTCPLCSSRRLRYAFSPGGRRTTRCGDCQLLFLNPRPAPENAGVYPAADGENAARCLSELARYRGAQSGRLLLLGDPASPSPVRREVKLAGYEVVAAESPGEIDGQTFDVCLLWHSLARQRDPAGFLRAVQGVLKPDGVLAVATPSLDAWAGFRADQLNYFDSQTLQTALFFAGFEQVIVEQGSDMLAFSRVSVQREKRVLSVVIPAFNEASSFEELLGSVLAKQVPSLDLEIIIVESNSTDGTREIALRYQDHPRVKVILEDRPRGKGHAVRTGLAQATGDFVLIQDADLEYDLEDYDALLEPLIAGREAFVLGSRHSGSVWKMRQFSGQASLSAFLNFGHWFFTTLVNVLFGQRLKDPFTMFKVFRRDCLFGLKFECNRFDFDYELLVKLIRKGYRPLELPVNYRSRSFKQGKKVSMIRDPLTWLHALLKLRFARIEPLAEVERSRAAREVSIEPRVPAVVAEKAFCV